MKVTRTCSIEGCERRHEARGWCKAHWQRWAAHGDVRADVPIHDATSRTSGSHEERFWAKVDVGHPLGCWEWAASCTRNGYGQFAGLKAHRFAYELLVGPIPDGLTLDHLCRVRHCVNPDHLEPVTVYENTMRSPIAPAAVNARKTHCKRGHEFTAENTHIHTTGRRYCRECQRVRRREKAAAA